MKIGILSDNHGHIEPVVAAMKIFDAQTVDAVVHCGDMGGLGTLELLVGKPFWFVWGNTDYPEPSWRSMVQTFGGTWPEQIPVVLEFDRATLAILHGHEPGFMKACNSQAFDYILFGHAHRRTDRRVGRSRIINPGALHRTPVKTVAILNSADDHLEFFEISSTTS